MRSEKCMVCRWCRLWRAAAANTATLDLLVKLSLCDRACSEKVEKLSVKEYDIKEVKASIGKLLTVRMHTPMPCRGRLARLHSSFCTPGSLVTPGHNSPILLRCWQ